MRRPSRSSSALRQMFLALGLLAVLASPARSQAAEKKPVDFNRDIRPILSNSCFACHGPDEETVEADLRLDLRESAVDAVEAIVPHKSAESSLIARVTNDDPDEQMPPAGSSQAKLTPEQVELLRRWIDEGAEYAQHWSYEKPVRGEVPKVDDSAKVQNSIDAFVLRRLKERGYESSKEADRRTLIRRLSFDLLGLPPSSNEVKAFIADTSPDAYERLVDRLLASPHYGERMTLSWLDMVRYADTNGIHGDNPRPHSPYRDYVINSFNDNKPFDEFTVEQIAGDLIPNATIEQKVASGYNRLNMTTREGGAQEKEYRAKYAADRVRNVSSVWLGATMGCCECHTHKFDPYTIKDFYRMAAYFADIDETAVGVQDGTRLPTAPQQQVLAKMGGRITETRDLLKNQTPELDAAQAEWETKLAERRVDWVLLEPIEAETKHGAVLTKLEDGSLLASGESPDSDLYTVKVQADLSNITALRLELMTHESMPSQGPGRSYSGSLVVNEMEVHLMGPDGQLQKVEFQEDPSATFEAPGYTTKHAIDGKTDAADRGWAIAPELGRAHEAVFMTRSKLGSEGPVTLVFKLHQNHGSERTIGRFRLSATNVSPETKAVVAGGEKQLNKALADALAISNSSRSEAQGKMVAEYFRSVTSILDPVREKLAVLEKERLDYLRAVPFSLISTSSKPRMMRVLGRGNWQDDTGEEVTPGTPSFLFSRPTGDRPATRLDLAKWMIDPENPLVARVTVNRLWKMAFGTGLVNTLDDFGAQGESPSHPELLDYLAVDFRQSGWDVKRMVKLIVSSQVYRQSSYADEAARGRDPFNRQLARQSRFRIDAEMIRDNALSISGLLVRKVGGKSVRPYQPKGYYAHLNFPKRSYQVDVGENQYRRGLYTHWQRTFLHPSLLAFDAPSREECAVSRPRSNTPLAALVLLNDPTYVEAARSLAVRMIREGGKKPSQRIAFAVQEAVHREPVAKETAILMGLLEKHLTSYGADAAEAQKIISVGQSKPPSEIDAVELAAYTSVARTILNLHETITRN